MPMYPAMKDSKPKMEVAIAVGKGKPNTFKLPEGYQSDDDSEEKEALLKFRENKDGTCTMISLDGAPFDGSNTDKEEKMDTTEMEEHPGGEETEMPEDMEGAIEALQKRDRYRR